MHALQPLMSSSSLSTRLKPEKARHHDIVKTNKQKKKKITLWAVIVYKNKCQYEWYILPYSIWDATKKTCRKRRDIYYCIWNIKTQKISQSRVQAVKDAAFINEVNLWGLTLLLDADRAVLFLFSRQTLLASCQFKILSKLKQPSWLERLNQVTTLYSSLQERGLKKWDTVSEIDV